MFKKKKTGRIGLFENVLIFVVLCSYVVATVLGQIAINSDSKSSLRTLSIVDELSVNGSSNGPVIGYPIVTVAYVEVADSDFANIGDYVLEGSDRPVFSIGIIFAANIMLDSDLKTVLHFNEHVLRCLKSGSVERMQSKGIRVLLSILGNHDGVGVSNFPDRNAAHEFAKQVVDAVVFYNLDGVDIDDEYADYKPDGINDFSFVYFVEALRNMLPEEKLITFYCFGEARSKQSYDGTQVGSLLSHSWNSNYGAFESPTIAGMDNRHMSAVAIQLDQSPKELIHSHAKKTIDQHYGAFMFYNLSDFDWSVQLSVATQVLYGSATKYIGTASVGILQFEDATAPYSPELPTEATVDTKSIVISRSDEATSSFSERRRLQVGSEFQINSNSLANTAPSVAALSNGGFVVVWYDTGTNKIHGRIYRFNGTSDSATDFQVNEDTTSDTIPQVSGVNGGFFVAWSADSTYLRLKGYYFDGTLRTSERYYRTNGTITAVFVLGNGDNIYYGANYGTSAVRIGVSTVAQGGSTSIDSSSYSTSGVASGTFSTAGFATKTSAFLSSRIPIIFQTSAQIKIYSSVSGVITSINFAAVTEPAIADISTTTYAMVFCNSNHVVYATMKDGNSSSLTSETIDTSTTCHSPKICTRLDEGGTVIAWYDSASKNVYAQMYTMSTLITSVGSKFQVNSDSLTNSGGFTLDCMYDYGFVIAWADSAGNVHGQRYDKHGNKINLVLPYPTSCPSSQPSTTPSQQPTSNPSQPSSQPTSQPSRSPSMIPTSNPSQPTGQPSGQPSSRPSTQPSTHPSRQPSSQPTIHPSNQPTRQPSCQPTAIPSARPSVQPSLQPTQQPTQQPLGRPSSQPSDQPTRQPSTKPSKQPSCQPSSQPSHSPSCQPSSQPSRLPSSQPTSQPSSKPTCQPTKQPSSQPMMQPSGQPSCQPSSKPTTQPSRQPSCQPTLQPSIRPSGKPTIQPSSKPSRQPLSQPTRQPTIQPSSQPSRQPTGCPSYQPTCQPTNQPSSQPSDQPTAFPSIKPTRQPSFLPSRQPSQQPSIQPSASPTSKPTRQPTCQPTLHPTMKPSCQPTIQPSSYPSKQPTIKPSMQPSSQPSVQPSSQPFSRPSRQPVTVPSSQPTSQPSCQPTTQPYNHPSTQPSVQPTEQPSGQPSVVPTNVPSSQPSFQPSAQPFNCPTLQPTSRPSSNPTQPSSIPTTQPSHCPSERPSIDPTSKPSHNPSMQPTSSPTHQPTSCPTSKPSHQPSSSPSHQPSVQPSCQPSYFPSGQPTRKPSDQPTAHPTNQPSSQPTVLPTCQPSNQPSMQPSSSPSCSPSIQPSIQPSCKPSGKPSLQPSNQPSTLPSSQPTSQPTHFNATLPSNKSISVLIPEGHFKTVLPLSALADRHQTQSRTAFDDIEMPQTLFGSALVMKGFSGSVSLYSKVLALDASKRSVSVMPDINNDGHDDLIIGDPSNSRCYVLIGRSEGLVLMKQGFTIFGETDNDFTGWSVSGAGDVNNDTIPDIIIGAPLARGVGAFYIIYGREFHDVDVHLNKLTPLLGFAVYGAVKNDMLGISVSNAGDMNRDGCGDVIVGAVATAAYNAGAAYIVYGCKGVEAGSVISSLPFAQGYKLSGSSYSYTGCSVSAAGDVNQDGFDDVLVGSNPQSDEACAYLIYGSVAPNGDVKLSEISPLQGFIISSGGGIVSFVGDVNDDGYDDMLIGGTLPATASNVGYIVFTNVSLMIEVGVPTMNPTTRPTRHPTLMPSRKPSRVPTMTPSQIPTLEPTTALPTLEVTEAPPMQTSDPSLLPSKSPTVLPSIEPTEVPTVQPSESPSEHPSELITIQPTTGPSFAPIVLTRQPSISTLLPSSDAVSRYPVIAPSTVPSLELSVESSSCTATILRSITINETEGHRHYCVNSTGIVSINNPKGFNEYTIIPNANSTLTIGYVNVSNDVIDLAAFADIGRFSDLTLNGSALILSMNQKIYILNLLPQDMPYLHFIFYNKTASSASVTGSDSIRGKDSGQTYLIVGGVFGGLFGCGILLLLAYPSLLAFYFCSAKKSKVLVDKDGRYHLFDFKKTIDDKWIDEIEFSDEASAESMEAGGNVEKLASNESSFLVSSETVEVNNINRYQQRRLENDFLSIQSPGESFVISSGSDGKPMVDDNSDALLSIYTLNSDDEFVLRDDDDDSRESSSCNNSDAVSVDLEKGMVGSEE